MGDKSSQVGINQATPALRETLRDLEGNQLLDYDGSNITKQMITLLISRTHKLNIISDYSRV